LQNRGFFVNPRRLARGFVFCKRRFTRGLFLRCPWFRTHQFRRVESEGALANFKMLSNEMLRLAALDLTDKRCGPNQQRGPRGFLGQIDFLAFSLEVWRQNC